MAPRAKHHGTQALPCDKFFLHRAFMHSLMRYIRVRHNRFKIWYLPFLDKVLEKKNIANSQRIQLWLHRKSICEVEQMQSAFNLKKFKVKLSLSFTEITLTRK